MLWHASVFHFSFEGEPQKIMLSLRSHTYKATDYMVPCVRLLKEAKLEREKAGQ